MTVLRRTLNVVRYFLLFVKAAKVIALALIFLPISGCAMATGTLFNSFLRSVAYAPEQEEKLFNYMALGFAFIETFALILVGVSFAIASF